MKRALHRTRRLSVDRAGEKQVMDIPMDKLDATTAFAYEEAERAIDKLDLGDVPVSPIDHMLHKMTEAGMNVGELTGRQLRLDYSTSPPTVIKRDKAELKNRRLTVDGFNNNEKDALVLNAAGATGLSIHASCLLYTSPSPRDRG